MITMNTYYCDLSWRGGVVVVAESEEKALELIEKQSCHTVTKVTLLEPEKVYTFMGDS